MKHLFAFWVLCFLLFLLPILFLRFKKKITLYMGPSRAPPEARASILRIGCTGLCTALLASVWKDASIARKWMILSTEIFWEDAEVGEWSLVHWSVYRLVGLISFPWVEIVDVWFCLLISIIIFRCLMMQRWPLGLVWCMMLRVLFSKPCLALI